MSENLDEKALEYANSNHFRFINNIEREVDIKAFKAGYNDCKKEYEEKLRWIPVEEKLPEKIQKQPYITHVVQVKSTTFAEPLCAYYNHEHCVWLSYPFGNSAKLLTVTHWRYFNV